MWTTERLSFPVRLLRSATSVTRSRIFSHEQSPFHRVSDAEHDVYLHPYRIFHIVENETSVRDFRDKYVNSRRIGDLGVGLRWKTGNERALLWAGTVAQFITHLSTI